MDAGGAEQALAVVIEFYAQVQRLFAAVDAGAGEHQLLHAGGVGTVTGAVVGALIMGVLNNGMSLLGWSVDIQRVVKGLVLLAAVAVDLYFKKKKNG